MTSNLDKLAILSGGNGQLISGRNEHEIIGGQVSKQDKKIQNYTDKMNSYLTDDEAANSIITTPQSQWNAYQIATANLNPDLKARNKKYQSALNDINVLENEKVNLTQAGEMMMNAYRDAISSTQNAADNMMYSNAANAAIQAGGAISGTPGLANNSVAAAQTRLSAQNVAALQNAQIRSNADQNIGNIYGQMANIPQTLSSIGAQNANIDLQKQQLDLQKQQAQTQSSGSSGSNYYSGSTSTSKSSGKSSNTAGVQWTKDGKPTYNGQALDVGVDKNGNIFIKNAAQLGLKEDEIRTILSQFPKNNGTENEGQSSNQQSAGKRFNPYGLASYNKLGTMLLNK